MKVTKYPQSCLIIEKNGKRLAIDPGSLVSAKYQAADLLPIDGIIITHEHSDHFDLELLQTLTATPIPVIGNQSTNDTVGKGIITQVVSDSEQFSVAGFEVVARDLPHCLMVDGSAGPQNTGYVIDGIFFHAGDGTSIEDLQVEKAAIPFAGPDISPHDIFEFIKQIGATMVIPIHHDAFTSSVELIGNWISKALPGTTFVPLEDGESAEL